MIVYIMVDEKNIDFLMYVNIKFFFCYYFMQLCYYWYYIKLRYGINCLK